tara:strand:+ start:946 stop:1860 length:915 start_codon:yes stop_codon:yes gene_type:complete
MISKYTYDEFIKLGANKDTFDAVRQIPEVSFALDKGGMIAGGICRSILLGKTTADVVKDFSDIDIFFENSLHLKDYMSSELIMRTGYRNSRSGICDEFLAQWFTAKRPSEIKIQIIKKLFNSPEHTLLNFDFTNVRIAVTKDLVYIDDKWFQVEQEKLLDVKICHSPLLGNRIRKYLNDRDLVDLTEESREIVTTWVIKAVSDSWDDNPFIMSSESKNEFKKLFSNFSARGGLKRHITDTRVFSSSDLIFLINKFVKNVVINYDTWETKSMDVAIEEIKDRKNEKEAAKSPSATSTDPGNIIAW